MPVRRGVLPGEILSETKHLPHKPPLAGEPGCGNRENLSRAELRT